MDLALVQMQVSGWSLLQLSLKDLLVLEGERPTTPTLAPLESASKPLSNDPFMGLKHLPGSGCPTCFEPPATFQAQCPICWGQGCQSW